MKTLRSLILARPMLAMLLLVIALCVKAAVPAGYMVSASSNSFTVGLCSDGLGGAQAINIALPMDSALPDAPVHKSAADSSCAFNSLSMAMAGGAGAPLLVLALLFILALGFARSGALPRVVHLRLRPPSQGPPVLV